MLSLIVQASHLPPPEAVQVLVEVEDLSHERAGADITIDAAVCAVLDGLILGWFKVSVGAEQTARAPHKRVGGMDRLLVPGEKGVGAGGVKDMGEPELVA
jgi:hypothetical protein